MSDPGAARTLIGLYMQYWQSLGILAAANLGIADGLNRGPRRVEDLAEELGLHPRALARLMRALSSRGIFRRTGAGEFSHSALSESLRTGAPGGAREVIRALGMSSLRAASVAYEQVIQTGRSAVELVHSGAGPHDHLATNPEEADIYDTGMTAAAITQIDAIIQAFDFSQFATLVDLGGGRGALLTAILARTPSQRGVLFDVPCVIARAEELLSCNGVRDRCELRAGDFRIAVPGGADGYILRNVLHGYSDADCLDLLARIRRSARRGAHVIICEMVMPAEQPSTELAMFDLFLLLGGPESRVRAESEFRELLTRTSFGAIRCVPTAGSAWVIDAQANA